MELSEVIYIDEDITHATFLKFHKDVCSMDKPVVIINSDGGSYYDAMAIADIVRLNKLQTIGVGKVLSSAVLILAAGSKRIVYPSTWLLYHCSSYEQEGAHQEIKSSVEQAEREEMQSAEFMASVTSKSKKFWKKIADTGDYYFTAQEALKLGVVDAIL